MGKGGYDPKGMVVCSGICTICCGIIAIVGMVLLPLGVARWHEANALVPLEQFTQVTGGCNVTRVQLCFKTEQRSESCGNNWCVRSPS